MSESKESSNFFGTCVRKSGSNDKCFHHLRSDGSDAEFWTSEPISIRPVFYIVVTPWFREGAAGYCHARALSPDRGLTALSLGANGNIASHMARHLP